jgi:mycofactocin system creatininase family protein
MSGLGGQTWQEVSRDHPVLLVPLGSCEQHGPHLPLDTDTRIAVAIATGAASQPGPVASPVSANPGHGPANADTSARGVPRPLLVAPPLAYGASGEHTAFPGTLSIGLAALEQVLVELVRSADHFRAVVLVNGHGGNAGAVERAVQRSRQEGRVVVAWFPEVKGGDAHAGRTETSLMLAIAPDAVCMERAESGCSEPLSSILPTILAGGVVAVATNGVLGDPAGASADEGRVILARLVDDLARTVATVA